MALGFGICSAGGAESPLSPEEGVAAFAVEEGWKVEIAAAEPEVFDPVAMAFDERGRMFVAENRGYPSGPETGGIALLEDADGDGRFETRREFALGLCFPNGVLPWKGGVFVTCAPDLLYLKDLDGDGVAEEKRVVLTGFATGASTQLRVNDPTLGPDGWIYLASGLSGGTITAPEHPERVAVKMDGHDLRFDPHTGAFEIVDGRSQYGMTFDEEGNRFVCMNRIQAQHVVMEERFLRRNRNLAFSETMQNLPEERIDDLLRGDNAAARIYPISGNVTTATSHQGTFSAACAVTWFDGGLFSCDPTGNLVHRDVLVPAGATFAARRSAEKREFLASRDDWCRPVFLTEGPDGALYVCDMYRKTIEHPDYLPEELRKHTDFQSGKDKGRIYRVFAGERFERINLDLVDNQCAALLSRNPWARATAFRLLQESRDDSAFPLMKKQAPTPLSLALLDKLGGLDVDLLARAATDESVALRVVASRLGGAGALEDANPRVRFHAVLRCKVTEADLPALVRVALAEPGDRWTRAAVFSSISGLEIPFLQAVLALEPSRRGRQIAFARDLGQLLGVADQETARALVAAGSDPADVLWRMAFFNGLGAAPDGDVLADLRAAARGITGSTEERLEALRFLGRWGDAEAGDYLFEVLDAAGGEPVLRRGVIGILCQREDPRVGGMLLAPKRWAGLDPLARAEVVSGLLARKENAEAIAQALEDGRIHAALLDAPQRKRLLEAVPRVAELFEKLGGERMAVYEEWKPVAAMPGDAAAGKPLFAGLCATCHRLDDIGVNVGPDLFGIRNQAKEAILLHILVPNREILPGFAACVVTAKDGRVFSGLVVSDSDNALTLRLPAGIETTLLRKDIATVGTLESSLMPDGLEQALTHQQMADLLAYLKGE